MKNPNQGDFSVLFKQTKLIAFALRCVVLTSLVTLFSAQTKVTAAEDQGPPGLNEKVGEALQQKMKPLLDAKNWNGALAVVDGLLATIDPNSYDNAFLSDIKAKIFLQKNDYAAAIAPMETSLRLADAHKNYFDKKAVLDVVYFLAQIYYQEGTSSKVPSVQQQYFNKSAAYIKRWLQTSPKKNQEASLFYASILYNQAVVNPDKVDQDLVKKAKQEVREGLLTALKPKEGFYVLLLASLQQEGDVAGSAEVLEQMVRIKPDNKTYWLQLMASYLNMGAGSEKDEAKNRENVARAINTMERAQAIGLMKTPKDNYNLVTMYYNAGQFGKATDLLYGGLKDGSIESDIKNWQLLAYSYQQVGQDLQAIAVLKEAEKQFPSGQIDFQIGQIYSQMDGKTAEAFAYYSAAVEKGGLDKPHSAYMFLAYTAFELEKFDVALAAINKTASSNEGQKDVQMKRLKQAIEEAIKERDAAKAAAEPNKL
jgi:tetratricopeptide (TPR) repeat protein